MLILIILLVEQVDQHAECQAKHAEYDHSYFSCGCGFNWSRCRSLSVQLSWSARTLSIDRRRARERHCLFRRGAETTALVPPSIDSFAISRRRIAGTGMQ